MLEPVKWAPSSVVKTVQEWWSSSLFVAVPSPRKIRSIGSPLGPDVDLALTRDRSWELSSAVSPRSRALR